MRTTTAAGLGLGLNKFRSKTTTALVQPPLIPRIPKPLKKNNNKDKKNKKSLTRVWQFRFKHHHAHQLILFRWFSQFSAPLCNFAGFFFCGMIWISFGFWMPRKQSLICLVVEMALMKGRKRVWSATACGGRACWGPVSPDFQGSCCFRVNFWFFPFLSFNFFFLVSENHLLL